MQRELYFIKRVHDGGNLSYTYKKLRFGYMDNMYIKSDLSLKYNYI